MVACACLACGNTSKISVVYDQCVSLKNMSCWVSLSLILLGTSHFFLSQWLGHCTSGKHPDSDKAIYGFKIYKISIITIRITYHQINVDINPWSWWISQHLPVLAGSPILGGIANFGIQCQLFIIKYLAIKEWYCNCQKHQKFHIWLLHLHLTYLISGGLFFPLTP